jgi:hypothetical protein
MSPRYTDISSANNRYRWLARAMSNGLTDLQLLHELEPVVVKDLNRQLSMRKDWNPYDYIP